MRRVRPGGQGDASWKQASWQGDRVGAIGRASTRAGTKLDKVIRVVHSVIMRVVSVPVVPGTFTSSLARFPSRKHCIIVLANESVHQPMRPTITHGLTSRLKLLSFCLIPLGDRPFKYFIARLSQAW